MEAPRFTEPLDQPAIEQDAGGAAALWTPRVQLNMSIAAGVLLFLGVIAARVGSMGSVDAPALTIAGTAMVWLSLAIGMVYGLRAAGEALAHRSVDIDVLMVVGAALAAWINHPEEGALLLFLFTLAGALEDLAMARTKREIEALHRLMPTEAIALREGEWRTCAPESLEPGERIKIRPGDLVAVDAEVAEGQSSVDQSTLTGESLPREVVEGETIFSGTVNLDRTLEAVVLRPASESSLNKILRLVTVARQQREPIQRLIDRVSQPYAIGVLGVSALVLLVWWLGFGDPFERAAYTAITLLIVMSPCAIIIATPTVTLTTIARGARAGVLFKGGQAIERLSRVGAVCFDKTGTLTVGRATLSDLVPVGWSDSRRLLSVAAALEADSTHPIARAVREAAKAQGVAAAAIDSIVHAAGRGVSGVLGSDPVAVGDLSLVEEVVPVCLRARLREVLDATRREGQVAAAIAAGGEHGAAAVMIISDPIRPGAAALVRRLHELGVSPVRMLTGDNRITAERVALDLGLDEWDAELLPEDKVHLVHETKARTTAPRRFVAFIGDGVNDAPALSAADVAIGIGSIGSDAALESSDIVLLSDDLESVPWAMRLARRARSILRFNIALALGIIVAMGLATLIGSRAGVTVPMSLGVVAHEGGTLLVVVNSLRLLWARGVEHTPAAPAPPAHPARSHPEPALSMA